MLTAPDTQRIYLATAPTDMRGGFDRLAGRVLSGGLDLYAGHLFVFVSRRRRHLKVLTWDGTGMVVTYKRLGRGRFTLPVASDPARTITLDTEQLTALLAGSATMPVGRSSSSVDGKGAVDSGASL